MLITVAVLASLAFIAWVIYRAARGRQISAHTISYALSCIAGVFTYAFFLSMNIAELFKVVLSILLGITLIFLSAYLQRRKAAKPE